MNEATVLQKADEYPARSEFIKFSRMTSKDRELVVQKVVAVTKEIDSAIHFQSVLAQLGYTLTTKQQADCYMLYRKLRFSFRSVAKIAKKSESPIIMYSRLDLPTDALLDRLVKLSGVPDIQILDKAIESVAVGAMHMRISMTKEIEHAYKMELRDVRQLGDMLDMFGKPSNG